MLNCEGRSSTWSSQSYTRALSLRTVAQLHISHTYLHTHTHTHVAATIRPMPDHGAQLRSKSVRLWWGRKNRNTKRKNPRSKGENEQETQATSNATSGSRTHGARDHSAVADRRSHRWATLASQSQIYFIYLFNRQHGTDTVTARRGTFQIHTKSTYS